MSGLIKELLKLHNDDGYRTFGRLPGQPPRNPPGEAYCTHCQLSAPCPTVQIVERYR